MPQRILYISPTNSAFVKKDLDFLRERFEVDFSVASWSGVGDILFSALKQMAKVLGGGRQNAAILVMFAGHWSVVPVFLGKLLNVPVYIILGGTDCVSFPAFGYGSLRGGLIKKAIAYSVKHASRLLPVDDTLIESENTYVDDAGARLQGLKHFFPEMKTPSTVIYNGFDAVFFKAPKVPKKENTFICVAGVDNQMRFQLKGLDLLFKAAVQRPDFQFTMVGVNSEFASKLKVPQNVRLFPFLPAEEFRAYLDESMFYVQMSISEGFPNALCEGMLAQCIPVGSTVGAIPKIIGETGFLCDKRSVEHVLHVLEKATSRSSEQKQALAEAARQRIEDEFPISRRAEAFFKVLG